MNSPGRVALVHDWLVTYRGGEKVLSAMAEMFPNAPIYTLFHAPGQMPESLNSHRIVTSFLDRIPGARDRHRWLLPLMPAAASLLHVDACELLISSSHCVAKSVHAPPGAKHLSYVHAPLRYMWDRFDDYFGPEQSSAPVRWAARAIRPIMQRWDVSSSRGVDSFVANSHHVAAQVLERYHRQAQVIHPPIDVEFFSSAPLPKPANGSYFLCFGALAPYKRIDLAIEAFRQLGLPLWIGGSGQSSQWLSSLPNNVKALGQVPKAQLVDLFQNARALVFPGVEDFGLTPLEVQACGRPVIALGQGGALETVTTETGVFFGEQTVSSLKRAVERFVSLENTFAPSAARANAMRFSVSNFQRGIMSAIESMMNDPVSN